MVFIPDLVKRGVFGLQEEPTEELAIFFMAGIAFVLYLLKENQLEKNMLEKSSIQKDASRMSKDLTSSYSYIGEINRKLEIFKNVSLGIPIWLKNPKIKEKDAFEYIMAAIKIITRADEYLIRFVDEKNKHILLELGSKKTLNIEMSVQKCLSENKKYFETNEYMVTITPEGVDRMMAILVIKKKDVSKSKHFC